MRRRKRKKLEKITILPLFLFLSYINQGLPQSSFLFLISNHKKNKLMAFFFKLFLPILFTYSYLILIEIKRTKDDQNHPHIFFFF